MQIDFEALENELAQAFKKRLEYHEEEEVVFTNLQRLGFVQVSPRKRIYIELAVRTGIILLRIVPAAIPKIPTELVPRKDDIKDGYQVFVSKAMNIPCNTPESYADPEALKKFAYLILEAAKTAQTLPLYDEQNKLVRTRVIRKARALRTKCYCGCGKQLARRKLIIYWRGMLFATMLCCKSYVKEMFPDLYIRIDDETRYIKPDDLNLAERECAVQHMTANELVYYHPEKTMSLKEALEESEEFKNNFEEVEEDGEWL